jgi:hypothetical protein
MELETINCGDYCISKIDSVNSLNVTRIDSLENLLNNHMISEKYFQDIISHQWTLLSIQTAIFIFLILLIVSLVSFISWKVYFKKLTNKINNLESRLANMPELLEKINGVENRASRALYEMQENILWKVVWHIRYIDWFVGNIEGEKIKEGLISRCKVLKKEYDRLKSDEKHFNGFKEFENKGNLKKTMIKIIGLEIKELTPIATEILNDLQ